MASSVSSMIPAPNSRQAPPACHAAVTVSALTACAPADRLPTLELLSQSALASLALRQLALKLERQQPGRLELPLELSVVHHPAPGLPGPASR